MRPNRFPFSYVLDRFRNAGAITPLQVYAGGKSTGGDQGLVSRTPPGVYLLELAVVTAAYFVAGRLGLAVPFTSGNVSPVWFAAGVAVAALLFSYRFSPAIAVGAFLVNYITGMPPVACIAIAIGNTLGPLCGVSLLRRSRSFQPSFACVRDVLNISFAALVGSAISATIGAVSLFAAGVNPWSLFTVAWLMWWLGDTTGVLVVCPVVLTCTKLISLRREQHGLELSGLLLATIIAGLLVFNSGLSSQVGGALVLALVPFVLWGAVRFGAAGTATVNLLIACIAVWETGHSFGPLLRSNPVRSAALLQTFLALLAVLGLALAAVVAQRAQMAREVSARETLQQTERRYGGILECANEGIWMLDAQLSTRFANHRMAELLRTTVEAMAGKSLFEFIFPEDIAAKKVALARRLAAGNLAERYESRYRRQDGSELLARVTTVPIFDQDGKFEGGVKWFSDLSEEKRSENERRTALETVMLLSRAVQQTADSILITDKTGVIQYVNSAFEALTGFSQQEAIGTTPRIVKSGQQGQDFYRNLWKCISEGQPFRGTMINRKKNGEFYWAEQSITPIADDRGNITHYVSVVKDISDSRKRQEQEMQLRLAREVQQRFYRPAIPVTGLEIAAVACPADETGGDYFDFVLAADNSFYVCIGDISGHGLGSALLMALTRAYVRSFIELQLDVADVVARVNRMLKADLEQGRFVTLMLVRIAASRDLLTYAGAGHIPGLVLNSCGDVEHVLESTGLPLGIFDDCRVSAAEVQLRPSQTLILMTDGLAETSDSEELEFGTEGILKYLRSHHDESAAGIVNGLYRAAREFAGGGPQQDDCALALVRIKPGPCTSAGD